MTKPQSSKLIQWPSWLNSDEPAEPVTWEFGDVVTQMSPGMLEPLSIPTTRGSDVVNKWVSISKWGSWALMLKCESCAIS